MIIFCPSYHSFISIIFFIIFVFLILYFVIEVTMKQNQRDLYMSPIVGDTSPRTNVCFSEIPNIYVDKNILKPTIPRLAEENKTSHIYDKVYEVNGTIFREQNLDDDNEVKEFQIQQSAVDGEMELTINRCIDLNFPTSLQETPYGIIINSNILLSINQWNTIVEQDGIQKCLICDTVVSNIPKHTHTVMHKESMEKYQPLNKYDLSIVRLIGDNYHCGVCNESFDRNNDDEHFDNKNHEERMLFATNRASDVMYDFDLRNDRRNEDNENENIDCYHFDRNRILSVSDTSGFNSECIEGFYDNDYDIDENASVVYDNEVDVFNETGDDFNDTNHVSYATMAKKHAPMSEFLEVILYSKKWRVKSDNWHMIITPKANHMYCMVCKKYEHISLKSNHCAQESHLNGLRSYKFVEAYKEYFVRKMDNRLYHCGLCNSLQLINEFDDHIDFLHKKKPKHLLNNEETPRTNRASDNKTSAKNTYNDEDVLQFKRNITPTRSETPNSCKTSRDTPNRNETPKCNDINRTETPKIYNTSRNEIPKNDSTNRNETPKCNDTNRNETPKNNSTNRNETPKYNEPNRNETQRYDDPNRNETPTNNHTNRFKALNSNKVYNCYKPYAVDIPNSNETENDDEYFGINDDVIINQYGQILRVSFLAYNTVVQTKPSSYFCHICDFMASEDDILRHIYDMNHIEKLMKISFERHYGINLIRLIRYKDHCTICNVTFYTAHTSHHIKMDDHKKLLDKALMNQSATNPSATGLNQTAINQPDTDLKLPKVCANLPITRSDLNINHLEKDMNQCTTDMNHHTNEKFDLNQSAKSETNVFKERNSERKEMKFESESENESESDEEIDPFNDKFIYIKHKNVYTKISMNSYNSLIQIGNGKRYCFICSTQVRNIRRHISNNSHIKCMKDCKFIIKYERHLLRQMFLTYHCSICNILFPRSQINSHIIWPQHLKGIKEVKKTKKNNFKTENVVDVIFQNESIYLKENEPVPKVLLRLDVKKSGDLLSVEKKNKMIIYDGNVLKISWDSWHSLRKDKNGFRCVLCQSDVKGFDVGLHINGDYHGGLLESFERKYLPCLIREVNESTLNCVICNVEVLNRDYIISEHIKGKKHKKQYDAILIDSSAVESYADCNDDVLNL